MRRPSSFTERLQEFPFAKKMIWLGTALILVGMIFPWYKDLDKFEVGDTFIGVNGPLYLAGVIMTIVTGVSFGVLFSEFRKNTAVKLPVRDSYFHLATAGLSALLFVLVNSVYFHSKFGTYLTEKMRGIGMFMAFAGIALMFLGGLWLMRTEKKKLVSVHSKHLADIDADFAHDRRGEMKKIREEQKEEVPMVQTIVEEVPPPRQGQTPRLKIEQENRLTVQDKINTRSSSSSSVIRNRTYGLFSSLKN